LRDGDLVPDFGESIELVGDEPADGFVVGGVGNSHPGPLQQFIRSPVGIEDQTPAVADQTRVGLVVLVAQLADDLLHFANGSARAKFFGTSSPITIDNNVARPIPTTAPTTGTVSITHGDPVGGCRGRQYLEELAGRHSRLRTFRRWQVYV
jgi:hypothetical protein